MIFDTIDNRHLYAAISPRIKAALEYLAASDFSKMEAGRYEIDGDNVYAMVQEYKSEPKEQRKWECHKKYIDVQYVHSGSENILVAGSEGAQVIQPYEEDNDCELSLLKEWSTLRMEAGMGSILYPEDLHAPGIRIDKAEQVEKIVVKVKID